MSDLITSSLIWRFCVRAAAWLKGSFFGRFTAFLGRLWRQSAVYGFFARLLCAPSPTERSAFGRLLERWNLWLHKVGKTLRRLLAESAAARVYRSFFAYCGRSYLVGKLFAGGLTSLLLCAMASYGIIDYLLRDVLSIGFLASVWDEGLMLLSFVWILLRRAAAQNPIQSRANTMDLYLGAYLLFGLLLLCATVTSLSINITGFRASMQYILLFFLALRLIRDDRDFLMMYRVMLVIAFVLALHGIWQFIVGVEIPSNWTDQAETAVRTRVFSIFSNPNIMGAYMLLFAPMAIGMAYSCENVGWKVFFWFCGICMCLACLFTMSRGAWLALAVAAVLFALIVDRKLFALMVCTGIAACFLPFVRSRIGYLFTPEFAESNARAGRAKRWETGLGYVEKYGTWSTGLGYGIFGGAAAAQNPVNPILEYMYENKREAMYVDNYYVKTLVENGYVGLSALLSSLLALLYNGFRACALTAKGPNKPLCAGMLSGLLGILIHSFFESLWEEPYMMALFFITAAMLIYAGFFSGKTKESSVSG